MNFSDELILTLKVFILDETAIKKVAHSKNSTAIAVIIILINILASALGLYLNTEQSFFYWLKTSSGSFLFNLSGLFILHALALRLSGQAKFKHFFRVLGRGYLLGWLSVIPLLGLISVWQLMIIYKSLIIIHQIDKRKAVLSLIYTLIVILCFTYFLEQLLGKSIFWK